MSHNNNMATPNNMATEEKCREQRQYLRRLLSNPAHSPIANNIPVSLKEALVVILNWHRVEVELVQLLPGV